MQENSFFRDWLEDKDLTEPIEKVSSEDALANLISEQEKNKPKELTEEELNLFKHAGICLLLDMTLNHYQKQR